MGKNKKKKKKQDKRSVKSVLMNAMSVAIIIGAIFVWVELEKEFKNLYLGFIDELEFKALDLKFKARGVEPTQNKVAIAAIDERSIEKYGRWPWDRKVVANLIDSLNELGARVIAFDVVFSDEDKNSVKNKLQQIRNTLFPDIPPTINPDDEEEDDEDDEDEAETEQATEEDDDEDAEEAEPPGEEDAMAQAAKVVEEAETATNSERYKLAATLDRLILESDSDRMLADSIANAEGKVVLGFFIFAGNKKNELKHLDKERIKESFDLIATSKIALFNPLTPNPPEPPYVMGYAIRAPLPIFAEETDYFGHFSFQPDSDGTLRWATIIHGVKFPEYSESTLVYPSLSLKSAAVLLGGDEHNIVVNYYDAGVYSISLNYVDAHEQPRQIQIPTDAHGRMLINYHGPKGTFPHYSVVDIINKAPNVDVKDKIVLVGATAIGIYDMRVTPFQETFPGVEVHANIIDNIIARQFIKRPYEWAWMLELGLLIFFALMFGWAISRLKAAESIFIVIFFLGAFILFDRFWLFPRGYIIRSVFIITEALTIVTFAYIVRYLTEERERKKIRSMFSHYLNDDIIKELEEDPDKMRLGGEKKELSILFSDIAGFTTISEKLPAEELTVLLNQYLTPMTRIVFENKGLLDKYIGDAVMAVFGTPHEEDHPFRACNTAVQMIKKIEELKPLWKKHGIDDFHARVGINTGMVSVGNMGSDIRFDYTVIGDAVNLASRLEGINKQYGTLICISENTYKYVKDRVTTRELDAVRVKGKKEPTYIYELIDIGKPDSHTRAWIESFEEALAHYRAQEWDKAVELFEVTIELRGGKDNPSAVYLKRIEILRNNPPGPDWDGVWTMTTK